jgi:hypothetical protein
MQPHEPPVVPVNIFRHPLLQDFMLTLFCKLPVVSGGQGGESAAAAVAAVAGLPAPLSMRTP